MANGVVVLVRKEDRYLLGKEAGGPYEDRWAPVHGVVEEGESLVEAASREALEEVNLEIDLDEKLAETGADYGVDRLHWYPAEVTSGEIRTNEEISETGYFTVERILNDDEIALMPATAEFFQEYREEL